jgi:hypothetical protein
MGGTKAGDGLQTFLLRHENVGQNDVKGLGLGRHHRFPAVGHGPYGVPGPLERASEHATYGIIIIDNENPDHGNPTS